METGNASTSHEVASVNMNVDRQGIRVQGRCCRTGSKTWMLDDRDNEFNLPWADFDLLMRPVTLAEKS